MVVQTDRTQEREALAHDRSADRYEHHAVLLERQGARRAAAAERRHAAQAREAAEAARRSLARG